MADGSDIFFAQVGTQVRAGSARRRGGDAPTAAETKGETDIDLEADGADERSARRWTNSDTAFWAAKATYNELPAGLYKCAEGSTIGPFLDRQTVVTDDLMILPEGESQKILNEFEVFWTLKEKFVTRGFSHKRGFLLWGPPGSGKTSLIQLMIQTIIETLNGVVIFIDNPRLAGACLQMVRKVEPDRPIICVMEDLDAMVEKHGEQEYLALLDGESQVSNIIFVATTNYPQRLDPRFVDRPSRFDTIVWIGMPGRDARRAYFHAKEPSLSKEELDHWVQQSDGFSIAHLREMIIACRCFGKPLQEVVERLEKMKARNLSSDRAPDAPSVGFTQ
jgi:energy-coupling factor transporter ATP-binding protein EcfA2